MEKKFEIDRLEKFEKAKFSQNWEDITGATDRLKIFGGWIVRTKSNYSGSSYFVAMVFVPDAKHEWVLE